MKQQRLALITLVALVAVLSGCVSATAGELLRSSIADGKVSHSEGTPCRDPAENDRPCSPTCACTCCPGHGRSFALMSYTLSPVTLVTNEPRAFRPDDVHPEDVQHRIFHPPRA